MPTNAIITAALKTFATAVEVKMSQLTQGEPEDQLRSPFEDLMTTVSRAVGASAVCTGETPLAHHLGRPDYAVHVGGPLCGYAELKAPGFGADTRRFTGHNRTQWERFSAIPNILYTDGNEWALYRDGQLIGHVVRLSGDIVVEGRRAIGPNDAVPIEALLRDFLSWQPIIPLNRDRTAVDLPEFARLIAPLCLMLRDDVADALKVGNSPFVQLARDWRQLLFPGASDQKFADAYAQTITFALLLGRSEGADPLTLNSAESALAAQHNLLSRALQVLTDPSAYAEIAASLDLLLRVLAAAPSTAMTASRDAWIYFYEDFLAAYDPKLRKDAGAYYTPIEVVHAQVRMVDDLLVNRLGKSMGFADPSVITLDPATGTGTYLSGVVEHALGRVESEQGPGAVPGQATALGARLYGFEIMVGPYAVSELRTSRALRDRGGTLPTGGTHVFLADTLESPHADLPQQPLFLQPLSDQHARARDAKNTVPVMVCLGNPPYDRHEAANLGNHAQTGGWVRWGDEGSTEQPILADFVEPVRAAGNGVLLKSLYNMYVYFWRWALWKVFEQNPLSGPGVVSFITASSYIDGGAFRGMRQHMREVCDEIWVLDLGGEGRGTRRDENIFSIITPVAICIALRTREPHNDIPANVHYARVEGTRDQKLAVLNNMATMGSVTWRDCPNEWQAKFRPGGAGEYFDWPLLVDLMPWQHSGVEAKRTWPIAPDQDTLQRRWRSLLHSGDRAEAFHETSDRKIGTRYLVPLTAHTDGTPICQLSGSSPMPRTVQYAYRSFDRQVLIADGRLISRPRPVLWRVYSDRQVFMATSTVLVLGDGPAVTVAALVPDLDYFAGRGGKSIFPLYRDAAATQANVLPGLLALLRTTYRCNVTPEEFLAYVYGVLAQDAFTEQYQDELTSCEIRVPITKDLNTFERVRDVGARLLWLHTYGERFVPTGANRGQVPAGLARCITPVPGTIDGYPVDFSYDPSTQTLRVGSGEFQPVAQEVYEYDVSGLKVVQSWLKYRMREGAGRRSSSLNRIRPQHWTDHCTTELLELLWILEATVAAAPDQADMLQDIVTGTCFSKDELPPVPDSAREQPAAPAAASDGLFGDTDG
ncbi:MAG: type ISP restriction/modification enzyme [Candidatus Cryosericum sp.]